jgi:hypothetical protein
MTGRIRDKTFYNLLFEQGIVAAPSYFHIRFLIAFLEEDFVEISYNNYTTN